MPRYRKLSSLHLLVFSLAYDRRQILQNCLFVQLWLAASPRWLMWPWTVSPVSRASSAVSLTAAGQIVQVDIKVIISQKYRQIARYVTRLRIIVESCFYTVKKMYHDSAAKYNEKKFSMQFY
jgi:hypothetical protein